MESKYYKAVFEVPALVRIELCLDAENQQEGLINAHDLIHQAGVADAKVVSLRLDQAQNVSFERVDAKPAASPLGATVLYRVELFDNDIDNAEPVRTHSALPYSVAQQLAESVLSPESVYGASRVIDELMNQEVLRCRSKRGGFEVEAYTAQQLMSGSPLADDQLATWLESRAAANRVAMQMLAREGVECVRILDFTTRSQGARVVRVIE